MNARREIERTARESCSRLVAFLAARSRDVAASEDALADAFIAALETWPQTDIPEKPEAWLLTVARRKLIDAGRRGRVHDAAATALLTIAEEARETAEAHDIFPDERLKLLFVCAHPAIDGAAHTPLMLQTVLGLDAARIASAFLVPPATMGQRLSRAKTKIRDAGIPFDVPGRSELPSRIAAVLEAIYAAYGSGWDDIAGADSRRKGLAAEALELGRLLYRLLPDEPEAQGLLSLMLFCESRRDARRDESGAYIPLSEQDTAKWSRAMIAEADRLIMRAEQAGRIGRFQLEAAIQCAHSRRMMSGQGNWEAVAILYEGLMRIAPTAGAMVGRAAAVAEAEGAQRGWDLLHAMPVQALNDYQPYWALAAHLLERLHRPDEASAAYHRAIALCEDSAMRSFLIAKSAKRPE